jgi:hypothetical protein
MYKLIDKPNYRSIVEHIAYLKSLRKCLENDINNIFVVSKKGSLKKSINANLMCGRSYNIEALERVNYNISLYE